MTSVLVAYASTRGSTAEIAEAISETLRRSGVSVDCIEAGKVDSVEPYDAVLPHVVFGGRLPVNPRGPMEHAMVKNTPPEYHDRRDWDEIRAWAAGIASEMRRAVPSG